MKLINRILLRVTLALTLILGLWAVFFYYILVKEINDEVDDSLEDYSELIIIRSLAGELGSVRQDGTNNSYSLREVTAEYARHRPQFVYMDSSVYIPQKKETEPARVLKTVFKGAHDTHFELEVSTPTFEKDDLQQAIWIWIMLLYVILLVIIVVICVGVVYRSMKPLYTLLHWLDHSLVGGVQEPLRSETTVKEFKKLNRAVQNYANRAQEIFEHQKQFIGNASHELQTPIAICQNRLEMLLEEHSFTESQLEEIGKTLQTLEYISKLNKSLLLLSKIDNRQFSEDKEVVLNAILNKQLEDYEEVYAYKKIRLTVRDEGNFRIRMDESLATILLTNLLKNAYVHTPAGGEITLLFAPQRIFFRNTADSGALDGRRIFDRFYQQKKKEGSTGLGLAIVDSICRLYGLRITYRYEGNAHVFELSFA